MRPIARLPLTRVTPPRPGPAVVARPRLGELLDSASAAPLTLVVGGPATGKSTAVAAWAQARAGDVAWLSCDRADSRAGYLWESVLAAIDQVRPDVVTAVREATGGGRACAAVDVVLTALDDLDRPLTLVLDQADRCGELAETIVDIVDTLPDDVNVVMVRRTMPQRSLARLVARGLVHLVLEHDLAFRPAETAAALAARGHDLPAELIGAVQSWSAGWVGGLVLLADAWSAGDIAPGTIETPSSIENVLEEFLGDLPERHVRLLTDLSVLDSVGDAEVDAVAPEWSEQWRAVRTGLPLLRWDDQGTATMLECWRTVLADRLSAGRAATLHERAATWLAERGEPLRALRHACAIGRGRDAIARVAGSVTELYRRDGGTALREGLAPAEDDLRGDPRGLGQTLMGLAEVMRGHAREAEHWLGAAARRLDAAGETSTLWLVATAACHLQRGDAEEGARRYDQLIERGEQLQPSHHIVGIRSGLWLNDHTRVRQAVAAARTSMRGTRRDVHLALASASEAAAVFGALDEAEELAATCRHAAADQGWADHPDLAEAARAHGIVCYERGDLPGARDHFERALDLAGTNRPSSAALSHLARARLALAARDPDAAAAEVDAARRAITAAASPLADLATTTECRVAMARGELRRAERLAAQLASPWRRARMQARVRLATKVEFDVAALTGVTPDTPRALLDSLVLVARHELLAQHEDRAALVLAEAAGLAGPRWIRPFVEDGVDLLPVLRRLPAARDLAARFEPSVPAAAGPAVTRGGGAAP